MALFEFARLHCGRRGIKKRVRRSGLVCGRAGIVEIVVCLRLPDGRYDSSCLPSRRCLAYGVVAALHAEYME